MKLSKINNLLKEFNFAHSKIDFGDLAQNYDDYTERAFFNTSGLLTAVHQYYYYSKLPLGVSLFEGYLGSEFVKGELSDGMYTDCYYDIVKNNSSVKDSINKHFIQLDIKTRDRFSNYINEMYGNTFKNVDSEAGKVEFQKYLVEFIPSKVFGGIINHGLSLGIKYYLPYFSPIFLKNLFKAGYGIKNNISVRSDHPGGIKIIEAHAKIVEKLNKKLYNTLLDRNVKYSEYNYPDFLSKSLRSTRNTIDRIRIKKYKVTAQVDYQNIKQKSALVKMGLNGYMKSNFGAESIKNSFIEYVSFYLNVMDFTLNKNNFSKLN